MADPTNGSRRPSDATADGSPPTSEPSRPAASGPGVPYIESLLGRQLGRIRRRFLIHGIGWVLAAAAGVLAVYYLVDRSLELPTGVRALLSLAAVGWLGYRVWTRVFVPQSRALDRRDVAIALERRFPGLQGRLITAHQLGDKADSPGALRHESPAMVRKVVEQAVEEASQLPTRDLFDSRRTARVWGLGGGLAAVLAVLLLADPQAVRPFGLRILGLDVSYPRATRLFVELPPAGKDFRIARPAPGRAVVTLPAGADLPVLVRTEGVVPREVLLEVRGGRGLPPQIAMTPRREDGRLFRHVFRRVREDLTFHASGNDDPRGDLLVDVRVVQPPRVGTISAVVAMPEYTGRPPETIEGGAIEALIGSRVSLSVQPTSRVVAASLRFLESGRTVELTAEGVTDDSGAPESFTGAFDVQASDRYQVELIGPDALRNPDPGTYPVLALEDLAPAGRLLLPDDASTVNFFLPEAVLPLRVRATDDYGLGRIVAELYGGRDEDRVRLELLEADGEAAAAPTELVVTRLIPLADELQPTAGEGLTIEVALRDRRSPEPLVGEVPARPVYVVEPTELARRIASHFRQVREDVETALRIQRTRLEKTDAIVDDLSAGRIEIATVRGELARIEVGQGRVLGEAQRVHLQLMRAFDVHLFNRLEESVHADSVLQLYRDWHDTHEVDSAYAPAFYREVARARDEGRIGAMERTLDPVLAMVVGGDRLALDLAPRAVESFEVATITDQRTRLVEQLGEARGVQQEILLELEALLERLDQWNEFQDVVGMARALRNSQLDVRNRTRALQGR